MRKFHREAEHWMRDFLEKIAADWTATVGEEIVLDMVIVEDREGRFARLELFVEIGEAKERHLLYRDSMTDDVYESAVIKAKGRAGLVGMFMRRSLDALVGMSMARSGILDRFTVADE